MIEKGKNLKLTKFAKKNADPSEDEEMDYPRSTLNKELVKCDKEIRRRDRRSRLQDINRNVPEIEVDEAIAEEEEAEEKETEKCDNACKSNKPNSTVLLDPMLSRRRKLLDAWRQEKKEKLITSKIQHKPIFKVQHYNPKEYEMSNLNVSSANATCTTRPYNLRSFSCNDITRKPSDTSRFNQTSSSTSSKFDFLLKISFSRTRLM